MRSMKISPDRSDWLEEAWESPLARAEYIAQNLIADCDLRRQELGLSYAELARRMGVSRSYIYKLMQGGSNNKLASLIKLAAALGAAVRLELEVPGVARKKSARRKRAA